MKRVVSSSFITLFIIVAVAATFFYLKNIRNRGGDPVLAIPADAVFLISYDPGSEKLSELLEVETWPLLKSVPVLKAFQEQMLFFDTTLHSNISMASFFSGEPLLLTGHVTGAGKFDFLFLKSLDNGFNESATDEMIRSVTGTGNEFIKRNYDGNIIREVALDDGRIFSFVTSRGVFIASFTPFLVEDALRQMKVGKPVITDEILLETIRSEGQASFCINFKNISSFTGIFMEPSISPGIEAIKSYGSWSVTSIDPEKNKIIFNGFLTDPDTLQFINCFYGQHPVLKKLTGILPRKTAVINYIGTDDFNLFYKNLTAYYFSTAQKNKKAQLLSSVLSDYKLKIDTKMIEWIGNEMALVVTEPSGMNYENNSFAVISSKNISLAKKSLNAVSHIIDKKIGKATMEESYNGHNIGFIRLNNVLPLLFGETFSKVTKMYYTDIENYIVFGNQASAVRAFIDEYKSGLLIEKTDFFKDAMKNYPAKANHFFFIRPPLASQIFKSAANAEWKKTTDKYKEVFNEVNNIGFQVMMGDSLIRIYSVVNFYNNKPTAGVDQVFVVETDSTVSMRPLLTTDPETKTRQMVFIDDSTNLYLADNSGNILWKTTVNGKIMSEIFEIDLFKNNSRQFLFNTRDYLYLLDTKGEPVGNYPIRLPASATNGIAVFDFDKNDEFKIYIACENQNVYAYLPSGKPLPGWNFVSTLDIVTEPIHSLNINNRDILLIADEEGSVAIVNRYGEQGIPVSKEFKKAKNSVIFKTKSGSLLTTNVTGSIVEIRSDGTIITTVLNAFSEDHGFLYADVNNDKEPDYIFTDEKEMTAYNSSQELIYRKAFDNKLSGPVQLLFLKNGEPVMGIRSADGDKNWLVKMDGNIYPGFPVKGSTPVIIDELNLDGKKQLITGSKENRLFIYSID